jgi:hypothetical protein
MGAALVCAVAAGCGAPPSQAKDEAGITYRAVFHAEAGVSAKVVFPLPDDESQLTVTQGLVVSDGGSARVEAFAEGTGLAVEGRGSIAVAFTGGRVKGLGEGGIPDAVLSRPVPDGGQGDRYFRVNKGGSGLVAVEFEYTAVRDCGSACGGKRSWKYEGPVGLSLQEVATTFSEEKKQ